MQSTIVLVEAFALEQNQLDIFESLSFFACFTQIVYIRPLFLSFQSILLSFYCNVDNPYFLVGRKVKISGAFPRSRLSVKAGCKLFDLVR